MVSYCLGRTLMKFFFRRSYGDSVVELGKASEKLTIEQIEAEIEALKKQGKI